ncbi:copper transport protein ATOX1 [Onthophagus taurus]|uniref:copper transport protein ATOX1 n=1 Tax=Onthophagus taurus TaxID=166361 RepID=UPI0039BE3740
MAKVVSHEYRVEMTCDGCSGAVERVLNKIKDKGIEKVDIDMAEQKVLVKTSLSAQEILEVIKKTGKSTEYIKSF